MPRMMGAAAYDGLFCHCCNQSRAHHHQRQRERQQWRRTEWQQADPRGYWDDAGCEPAYYLADDSLWIEFGGWYSAFQDGELPMTETG